MDNYTADNDDLLHETNWQALLTYDSFKRNFIRTLCVRDRSQLFSLSCLTCSHVKNKSFDSKVLHIRTEITIVCCLAGLSHGCGGFLSHSSLHCWLSSLKVAAHSISVRLRSGLWLHHLFQPSCWRSAAELGSLSRWWPGLVWALAAGHAASHLTLWYTRWRQGGQLIIPPPPCWQLVWGVYFSPKGQRTFRRTSSW